MIFLCKEKECWGLFWIFSKKVKLPIGFVAWVDGLACSKCRRIHHTNGEEAAIRVFADENGDPVDEKN